MSKNSADTELLRISGNAPGTNMSTTNSLDYEVPDSQTGSSEYQTLGEGEPPNKYDAVVPNKKRANQPQKYSSHHPSSQSEYEVPGMSHHPSSDYGVPGEGEPPNKYDDVVTPNKQRTNQRQKHSGGMSHHPFSEYEVPGEGEPPSKYDAVVPIQQYSGSTSHPLPSDSNDGGVKYKMLFISLVIFAVFLVAVTALILSLVGILSSCDCGETITDTTASSRELANLRSEVEVLKKALDAAQVNITAVTSELSQLNNNLDSIRENVSQVANDVINQRITEDGTIIGLNYSVELSGVQLYEGCDTSVPVTCSIAPSMTAVDGSSQCFTGSVPINTADTYVLDATCIRTQEVDESNPLVAILDVFNNEMACICSVVVPNAQDDPHMRTVHCGLQVTRCPRSLTIPANVVTTQTNF